MYINKEFESLGKNGKKKRFKEIALVFLKLGIFSFGGPAAHIALMDDEIVKKRNWLTRENFMDLLGATNLIPGPNSTELAIHLGYERGGLLGLVIAGTAFIIPAMAIVLVIAILYAKFGAAGSFEYSLWNKACDHVYYHTRAVSVGPICCKEQTDCSCRCFRCGTVFCGY